MDSNYVQGVDANYKDKQGLSLLHLVRLLGLFIFMYVILFFLIIHWTLIQILLSVGCGFQSNRYCFRSHGFWGKPGV